ncbi:hypothetical protein C8A03DRAFT_44521 [Achaetomium macrosporum]|uniref:Calcineurin-like phosphoesterase domain-containing protein n=1 Tax=Achaetomium macrosporum TaxID=79813 RepID=A0AAN7CAX4_9PEZI|nr:hypothetical protein C8A03DRAFT_44521 [Achaetomium macrosporum]
MQQPITSIKTHGHRRRRLAGALLARHSVKPCAASPRDPIRVVCVSDTHNKQPVLPPGDILIHAGDLTENGSFDEVQAGLTWLSSQPHRFKILIAGNHDVLLDEAFLRKYPERRYGQSKTKEDLDWGDVIYLEDSCVTLYVPIGRSSRTKGVDVFGSPWTPQYGISAFQYRPDSGLDHWSQRLRDLPMGPDIIVTHGPPKLYLDRQGIHQAGCPYLLAQIARIRPRLHVFGHIHAAYGRENVVLNAIRQAHDDVQIGWGKWDAVARMAVLILWVKVKGMFVRAKERTTTFVNASAVGGRNNELRNEPIVVEI